MSILNVANIINKWVETELSLPFAIYNDVIPDSDGDAACLRHDPSPAAERRYTDGTRLIKWNLTYYIRCKNRTNARNYAYNITEKLDGTEITDQASGIKIDCEAKTLPQFISLDDKQNTIYGAAVTVTYLEPGISMEV